MACWGRSTVEGTAWRESARLEAPGGLGKWNLNGEASKWHHRKDCGQNIKCVSMTHERRDLHSDTTEVETEAQGRVVYCSSGYGSCLKKNVSIRGKFCSFQVFPLNVCARRKKSSHRCSYDGEGSIHVNYPAFIML